MCFLYKQEEITYEDLLSATQEAEMEWTESKISVRAKSPSVEEQREEGATELKNKIDSLTAIFRSSTLGIGKPEGKEKKKQEKNNTERWTEEKYICSNFYERERTSDSSNRSIKR